MALAECCIAGSIGFSGRRHAAARNDIELFGEEQSRIVISIDPAKLRELRSIAEKHAVPLRELGKTGGNRLVIEGLIDLPLDEVSTAWKTGLEKAMK